jgi:D-alanyl-lipoteichoic acid acyltransferase DltB (MBOAT superfamily)
VLFNSLSFLAGFALLVVVHYAVAPRHRWVLLLAASLAWYATFRVGYVFLLLGVTAVSYTAGRAIEGAPSRRARRRYLAAGVVVSLGVLFVSKYYDFFATSLAGGGLPRFDLVVAAGLSFYTFSCVSYLADVHAGRLKAERHAGHFALYVAFFPKLLAGPIERAGPWLTQLASPAPFSAAGVTAGLQWMLWGLFKKVVVADRLAVFVDAAYRQPELASAGDLALATYFFAFQLYCDFSGYSDIAIGASKILGFDLIENFRRPYLSTSVREFWASRWHVSLAAWFRDYLYVPLGGGRVPAARRAFNVMVVFLVSGLWHGANWTFVVWGGLNGLYQVIGIAAARLRPGRAGSAGPRVALPASVRAVVTFHLVLVSWVFFRAASLEDAVVVFTRVAGSIGTLPALLAARLQTAGIALSIALIAVVVGFELLEERRPVWRRLQQRPLVLRWAVYYALAFALILLGRWNVQQFVYMQF